MRGVSEAIVEKSRISRGRRREKVRVLINAPYTSEEVSRIREKREIWRVD